MKRFSLCVLWWFTALAHAQVYQCPSASGVVFQQAPCAGGNKLQEHVESAAPAKPNSPNTRATSGGKNKLSQAGPAQPEPPYACPTASEIREAEKLASWRTQPTGESIAKKALVVAMKKCPRKITCGEILALSPDTKTAYAAAQRYAKLFDPNKQPYLQLDKDRDGRSCESYQ